MPPFHGHIGFNAHHSPMGAYFTFTCGHPGTRGGLAAELGRPANQDLYIGIKEGGRYEPARLRCLPFYEGAAATQPAAFTPEAAPSAAPTSELVPFALDELTRQYAW